MACPARCRRCGWDMWSLGSAWMVSHLVSNNNPEARDRSFPSNDPPRYLFPIVKFRPHSRGPRGPRHHSPKMGQFGVVIDVAGRSSARPAARAAGSSSNRDWGWQHDAGLRVERAGRAAATPAISLPRAAAMRCASSFTIRPSRRSAPCSEMVARTPTQHLRAVSATVPATMFVPPMSIRRRSAPVFLDRLKDVLHPTATSCTGDAQRAAGGPCDEHGRHGRRRPHHLIPRSPWPRNPKLGAVDRRLPPSACRPPAPSAAGRCRWSRAPPAAGSPPLLDDGQAATPLTARPPDARRPQCCRRRGPHPPVRRRQDSHLGRQPLRQFSVIRPGFEPRSIPARARRTAPRFRAPAGNPPSPCDRQRDVQRRPGRCIATPATRAPGRSRDPASAAAHFGVQRCATRRSNPTRRGMRGATLPAPSVGSEWGRYAHSYAPRGRRGPVSTVPRPRDRGLLVVRDHPPDGGVRLDQRRGGRGVTRPPAVAGGERVEQRRREDDVPRKGGLDYGLVNLQDRQERLLRISTVPPAFNWPAPCARSGMNARIFPIAPYGRRWQRGSPASRGGSGSTTGGARCTPKCAGGRSRVTRSTGCSRSRASRCTGPGRRCTSRWPIARRRRVSCGSTDRGAVRRARAGIDLGLEALAVLRELAERLAARVGILVVGGPEDAGLAADILRPVARSGGRAVSGCGRLTVRQAAEAIRRAAVLVTNDSAPLHLAQAVDTPTVAIFGSTAPKLRVRATGTEGSGGGGRRPAVPARARRTGRPAARWGITCA